VTNPLIEPLKRFLIFLDAQVEALIPLPDMVSSYAIALILIAVIVKALTYGLNASQIKSMQSMQALQPKIKALQEKHKDDREKFAQAQLELYKEHGVNPLGGCLPMVIQLPVLIGLYQAISQLEQEGRLAGERFLWVPDLATCEPNPLCEPQLGDVFGLPIPILLVSMTLAQVVYQRYMTPPSTDPQQQAMQSVFKWMPVMFAFMFARFSSGLVLYYTAFTLVNIAQQLYMRRGQPDTLDVTPEASDKSSPTRADARSTEGSDNTDGREPDEQRKRRSGRKSATKRSRGKRSNG